MQRYIAVWSCLLWALVIPGIAAAQLSIGQLTSDASETGQSIELPEPLTREAVRQLLARLSDQEVRALLLQRLDAVARSEQQAQAQEQSLSEFLGRAVLGVYQSVAQAVVRVPLLWQSQAESFSSFHARLGTNGILALFGSLIAAILIGLAAELAFNLVTRRWHDQELAERQPDTLRETLKFLFQRFCRDVFGLIVFFVVTRIAVTQLVRNEILPFAEVFMVNLVVFPRLGAAVARFLLAPNRPEFRLIHTDNWTAKYLHRNQIGLIALMGFSIAIVGFNDMNGVTMGQSRLGFWLNLAVHFYIIWIAWHAHDGLVMMMRGADPEVTPADERVARAYPWFVIWVSIFTWILVNILVSFQMFELLQSAPHYWMMTLLVMAPAMDTMVRGLVRHLLPPMTGEGLIAEQAHFATKRSYIRVGRVVMFAIVLTMIARIWGIDFTNLAAAGIGAQFAARLIEMIMILATGYLVWEVVTLLINRKLAAEQSAAGFDLSADEPGGGEGGGAGGSRLSTVLPLLRLCAQSAIIVITVLVALGNVGIDITPLLAGAGIVGLAIGFGAQTLVRDVVSGVFFLIDDAFRVGEYVVIGDTVGTVEKISIRSLQLRHHEGPVHTVPYGEIPKVTNNSRDWVIMKLKFTVPFDTDVNKIKRIFKKIGSDIMEADYADGIIQTFKSQGVYDVDDVGIIVRGKFMTKPGAQWVIRKDIYTRIQQAFDANGIEFARKEVRVNIPGSPAADQLSSEEKAAIGGAAADAAEKHEKKAVRPDQQ